jgi:hypothetical protein
MTYLKVLFDKIREKHLANRSGQSPTHNMSFKHLSMHHSHNSSNFSAGSGLLPKVDAIQMLDGFLKIKTHLPVLTREEYSIRHGGERGLAVFEVEHELKRLILQRQQTGDDLKVGWDDIIDLFILSGLNGSGANSNQSNMVTLDRVPLTIQSQPSHHKAEKMMMFFTTTMTQKDKRRQDEQDDLVNVSEGFCRSQDDERHSNVKTGSDCHVLRISQPALQFRAHRGDQLDDQDDDCLGELDKSNDVAGGGGIPAVD